MCILKKTLKDADINISFIISSKLNSYLRKNSITQFFKKNPFADLLITQTYADKKNYRFMKNVEVIYNPLLKKSFLQWED